MYLYTEPIYMSSKIYYPLANPRTQFIIHIISTNSQRLHIYHSLFRFRSTSFHNIYNVAIYFTTHEFLFANKMPISWRSALPYTYQGIYIPTTYKHGSKSNNTCSQNVVYILWIMCLHCFACIVSKQVP